MKPIVFRIFNVSKEEACDPLVAIDINKIQMIGPNVTLADLEPDQRYWGSNGLVVDSAVHLDKGKEMSPDEVMKLLDFDKFARGLLPPATFDLHRILGENSEQMRLTKLDVRGMSSPFMVLWRNDSKDIVGLESSYNFVRDLRIGGLSFVKAKMPSVSRADERFALVYPRAIKDIEAIPTRSEENYRTRIRFFDGKEYEISETAKKISDKCQKSCNGPLPFVTRRHYSETQRRNRQTGGQIRRTYDPKDDRQRQSGYVPHL